MGRLYCMQYREPTCQDTICVLQRVSVHQEQCVHLPEDGTLMPVEAAVAARLSHPHVVATYKYAVKQPDDKHEDAEPQATEAEKNSKELDCWMVMEMCNKGTLQVSIAAAVLVCTP
jgi:hypothetical protein